MQAQRHLSHDMSYSMVCGTAKGKDGKEQRMEEMLIDALRKASNKDIQALLLQTYIQEYGPLSDANGEIVKQILMKGADDENKD